MFIENGALVRDQNGDDLARYGDSCFETCAYGLSSLFVREFSYIGIESFFNHEGTVRHVRSPRGANDMSQDNELPLYMLVRELGLDGECELIADNIFNHGFRTGNGKFINLIYLAELWPSQWLRCFCLVMQAAFFLFPVYWNDGTRSLDWSSNKSDGYLQWALCASLAPRPFRRLISKKKLKQKISDYYACEPNSAWVVDRHHEMINLL